MKRPVTVSDLHAGQVGLDIECADRVYLNGYVPGLQQPGQIVGFLTRHLGQPIPSPALMDRIGQRLMGSESTTRDRLAEFLACAPRYEPGW